MNVHHLELFYYVARHGGIMEAVRNIPYGIQQPAVSGQIAKLEEQLGKTLFHRRPFRLTSEGEKLYRHIEPFFSQLEKLSAEITGGAVRQLRIGASATVLREHLPILLHDVRKKFPGLKIALREAFADELQGLLQKDELDLVVTLIEGKAPPGLQSMKLLEVPGVLLVPAAHPLKNADELWQQDRITETLICLPPAETTSRLFQNWLRKKNVDWFIGIEASSIDLVETYVANGLGLGMTLKIPGRAAPSRDLRALPLKDFPPFIVGALWRGPKTELINTVLEVARQRARKIN